MTQSERWATTVPFTLQFRYPVHQRMINRSTEAYTTTNYQDRSLSRTSSNGLQNAWYTAQNRSPRHDLMQTSMLQQWICRYLWWHITSTKCFFQTSLLLWSYSTTHILQGYLEHEMTTWDDHPATNQQCQSIERNALTTLTPTRETHPLTLSFLPSQKRHAIPFMTAVQRPVWTWSDKTYQLVYMAITLSNQA